MRLSGRTHTNSTKEQQVMTAWTDLPANVTFEDRTDGWSINHADDTIESVEEFRDGSQKIFELWGTTTAVSPAGVPHESAEFQQNVWIDLDRDVWRAKRLVRALDDEHPLEGLPFQAAGRR